MTTPEEARKIACEVEETGWEVDANTAEALRDLANQVEALQADAERYRWLRASHWYVGLEPEGDTESVSWHDYNDDQDRLDAAIDAARKSNAAK